MFVGSAVAGVALESEWPAAVALLVVAALILAFARVSSVRIRVLEDRVRVSVIPVSRVDLPLTDVVAVEPVVGERLVARFGGIGHRISVRGKIGLIAGPGPAVRLRTRRGRVYIASCDRPDACADAVRAAQRAAGI